MAEIGLHPVRVCTSCSVEKPADTEHFRFNQGRVQNKCLDCHRAYCKAYYDRNRERLLAGFRAARAADPEFHRQRDRRYFQENREAKRDSKKRQWAKTDRAEARLRVRAWKEANPAKAKAIEDRRLARIRASESERAKSAARMRRWRSQNPVAAAAARDRRRAKEQGAPGEWSRDDVKVILRVQGRSCFYCAARLTRFHCDHFIPLARGGSNGPENIVLACGPCNLSKGAKLPWEWLPERFSPGSVPR